MSRHTKKPWRVELYKGFLKIMADKNLIIAELDLGQTDPLYTELECLANANLIAAAPELLAAVKVLLDTRWDGGSLEGAIKAAKMAEAKAENRLTPIKRTRQSIDLLRSQSRKKK